MLSCPDEAHIRKGHCQLREHHPIKASFMASNSRKVGQVKALSRRSGQIKLSYPLRYLHSLTEERLVFYPTGRGAAESPQLAVNERIRREDRLTDTELCDYSSPIPED